MNYRAQKALRDRLKQRIADRAFALLNVSDLKDGDLHELKAYLAECTQGNCFWATYRIRNALAESIEEELEQRRRPEKEG